MPYVYEDAEKLVDQDVVGTKQCVALIKEYTNAPSASLWKEGAVVKGNLLLKKGTAIATFVGGKYQNHAHGNHAAFYIEQSAGGIYVVDQWSAIDTIKRRLLPFRGQDKNGKYILPSGNGDAFSVIE